MTRSKTTLFLVATVVGFAFVIGTGGVASVALDRNAELAVVTDESAYLGFEQTTSDTSNGTTNLTVTVSNQFPSGTDLATVEVTVNGQTTDLAAGGSLGYGEDASASFRSVPCGAAIRVVAAGDGTSVRLHRSVDCE